MDSQAFWNLIDIGVVLVSAGFNFAYYYTHVNGKKFIRLWISIILLMVAAARIALAFQLIGDYTFTDIIRPLSVVIYVAFMFGPYIDWNTKAKIERGRK